MTKSQVSRRLLVPVLSVALAIGGGAYFTGVPVASKALAQSSSCYSTFWPSGRAVEIQACEYDGRGSGYTILRNNSGQDMSVCWTIHYGNGESSRGCHSGFRAHAEAESSCYRCSHKKGGGLADVTWRKVEPAR